MSEYVGLCDVGDEGIKNLMKGNWPKMITMNICTSQII